MSVATYLAPPASSVKDLDEWNETLDRLMFADNEGIGFGSIDSLGADADMYSDGTRLRIDVRSNDLVSDYDRWTAMAISSIDFIGGVLSVPFIELNKNGFLAEGVAVQSRTLYLAAGDASEASIVFANTNDLGTALVLDVNMDTLALTIQGDDPVSMTIGSADDSVGFFGATPQAQKAHLADPTDLTEALAWAGSANGYEEAFGFRATS